MAKVFKVTTLDEMAELQEKHGKVCVVDAYAE